MEKLFGSTRSKTMLFSLLLVILGAIEASIGLMQSIIPPQYYGLVVMGIGIVTGVLRWITTTGLDRK
jgi:hypothetical protein